MSKLKNITLGSLFDGIGGFSYAASFFGIKTLWASEIMPQAISVTRRHMPDMEHVGDITELHGAKLPPVDIISFGSPCQDLSAAGKRAGITGSRSNLFYEAVRIINEMREATDGRYPRFALWENVPGAFHSNKGLDFKAVLEAFTEAEVPVPASSKWANAGMVRSQRVDIAWCVYNAQYFGTAQRRRRIFIVADFAGECAGEILFIPKSLRGYFEAGGTPWQGAPNHAFGCSDGRIEVLNDQGGDSLNVEKGGHSPTLRSQTHGNLPVVAKAANCLTPWDTSVRTTSAEAVGDSASLHRGAPHGRDQSPRVPPCSPRGEKTEFAISINTQVSSRHKALGKRTGFGVGEDGDPAYTLLEAHSHAVAVGVHQNQCGDVNTSPTAYTLSTTSNASSRNAPLVAHPTIAGTLCASASGLNRPGGMGSETDLCIVVPNPDAIPIQDKATRHKGGGDTRNNDGCGNGLGVGKSGDPAPTITSGDRHAVATYCLQGSMVGRQAHNGPCGNGVNDDISFTLNTIDRHAVAKSFSIQRSDEYKENDIASTQAARQYKSPTDLVCSAVDCRNLSETEELSGTLQSKTTAGYSLNYQNPIRMGYIVRRLTPTECERLQGYPDGWTEFDHEGKPISDTRRYQMLGNSVAVPCVAYIMQGMAQAFDTKHGAGKEAA